MVRPSLGVAIQGTLTKSRIKTASQIVLGRGPARSQPLAQTASGWIIPPRLSRNAFIWSRKWTDKQDFALSRLAWLSFQVLSMVRLGVGLRGPASPSISPSIH